MTALLWPAVAVAVGLGLLIWGADRFIHGAAATARNLGVRPMIIGLTVVGFGTSAPEILVSLIAAWQGNPGVAVGNALGSNIANIGLVMGGTALVVPLAVNSDTLRREYPLMFVVMLLALVLIMDGHLGRLDGAILLGALVFIGWRVVRLGLRREPDPLEAEFEHEIPTLGTTAAAAWTVAGLVVMVLGSRGLVWGAVEIARAMGISDLVIGLTIVAIGTSLPELAASIMSALKKEPDLALGNIIGSNIFNLLAVLGIPGLMAPAVLDPDALWRDYPVMLGLGVTLYAMAYGFRRPPRLERWHGAVLLAAFCGYLLALYLTAAPG